MATVNDLAHARATFLASAQGQRTRRAWQKGEEVSTPSDKPTDKQLRYIYVLRKKTVAVTRVKSWRKIYDIIMDLQAPETKRKASLLIETLIDVLDEDNNIEWQSEEEVLVALNAYTQS